MHCQHCYNKSDTSIKNVLSTDEILSIIDEAEKNNVIYFQITGGEPLIREDISEIIQYLYYKGFIVTIFTNLTLLTDEHIKILEEYNINCITSLDFYSDIKHDELRGMKGAHKKTLDNIKKLRERNINVRINFMINNKSIEELNELIYLIKELDSNYIGDIIIPTGRGEELGKYNNIEQIAKLYAYINSEKYKPIPNIKNLEECDYIDVSCYDCKVSRKFIFIDFEGNYILCPSLRKEDNSQFYIGNISQDMMCDVVKKINKLDIRVCFKI